MANNWDSKDDMQVVIIFIIGIAIGALIAVFAAKSVATCPECGTKVYQQEDR